MKRAIILVLILLVLTAVQAIGAGTDETVLLPGTEADLTGAALVWNEDGSGLILLTEAAVECINISEPDFRQTITARDGQFSFVSASENRIIAALSADRQTAVLFRTDTPGNVVKIEPGFPILSLSLSLDGKRLTVNSADEIRTVVFDTENGGLIHDLGGFRTAAPVYNSVLSPDCNNILWHARGTFALQSAADGSFGETISLWDFASAAALSPDNSLLAVSIINEDYENGTVIFFDPQTGEERGRTDLGKTAPRSLSFSTDGKMLIAADSDTLYRIDPVRFTLISERTVTDPGSEDDRVITAALSSDGGTAALLKSTGGIMLLQEKQTADPAE